MQKHTYYTYKIPDQIKPLKVINECACLHHERIDGQGYPFGSKGYELPLCSRIMAVADVFAAVTETRPYRAGMDKKQAIRVLSAMADNGVLDKELTEMAIGHYAALRETCLIQQAIAAKEYEEYGI